MKDDTKFTDCSPIFVVGSPRSGTTLLQLLLDAHPNIAILGELHYFDQILQLKRVVPLIDSRPNIEHLLALLMNTDNIPYIPSIEPILDTVKQKLINAKKPTYEKLYRLLMEEYARTQTKKRFGEKTPANVRYLDRLVDIFPNARIIRILRDPRAVVASMVRMPWTANDVVINALKWKCDILYSAQFKRKICMSYMEIKYEALVSNVEQQLRSICEFIGEEYSDDMLEFYKHSKAHIKNEPWKDGVYKPMNSSATDRWRNELSQAQIYVIEKIAGPLMQKLGYEESKSSLRTKLELPLISLSESVRYLEYKYKDIRMRRGPKRETIYGEKNRLYQMFFRSLFRNYLKER